MSSILIPRNIDSRIEKQKRIDSQRIQEYIKNGSEGKLDLANTQLTKLPDNLTRVGGYLTIYNSSIEDLNNLEYIGISLYADDSKLKSLPPKLTRIGGNASLSRCPIDNIDNLGYVGGTLWINHTNINELPEGLEIGGNLYVGYTHLAERFPDRESFREYLKERNIKVGGMISGL